MKNRTGSMLNAVTAKKLVGTSERETENTMWVVSHYDDGSSVETPYIKDLNYKKK